MMQLPILIYCTIASYGKYDPMLSTWIISGALNDELVTIYRLIAIETASLPVPKNR